MISIRVPTSPATEFEMRRVTVSHTRSKNTAAATICTSTSGVTMISSARPNSERGRKARRRCIAVPSSDTRPRP
jgi:hypothetical protein